MPAKRPGLLTAVAIIGIVLGSFGILSSLGGLAGLVFQDQMASLQLFTAATEGQRELSETLLEMTREFRPLQWVGAPLNLVASILLVVGGALALRPKPRSGNLLFVAAIASIGIDFYIGAIGLIVQSRMLPVMEEFTTQMAGDLPPGREQAMGTVMQSLMFVGVGFAVLMFLSKLAYYILAIVAVRRPTAKSWYSGEAT